MLIKAKVIPGSKKSKIEAKAKDEFVVWVKAEPKEHFSTLPERIKLLRGARSRNKLFEVAQ